VTRKVKMSRSEAITKNLVSPDKSMSVEELNKLKEELESRKKDMFSDPIEDSVFVDVEMDFSTIQDDVYWLEANLLLKRGDFVESIATLEKIITEFGEDILSDDAYFLEGEIYEQQLKNNNKAMEIYRQFLDRYPGSVYAAEARKRYRQLRGDFNEPEITPKF
jgi:tetratricopeptide (TPR) repeat protein